MKLSELKAIQHLLPDDTEVNIGEVVTKAAAHWKVWGGWGGNHDQRIEGAECSNCGYEHETVYRSLSNLAPYCPKCGLKMGVRDC